jgi:hypothetical protein
LRRKEMSNIFKTFQELLDYMDDNYVTDEESDDDESVDTWRSERFGHLIDKARQELQKFTQLPYPTPNICAKCGKFSENPICDMCIEEIACLLIKNIDKKEEPLPF